MYRVTQKSNPPSRLFHIFLLAVLCRQIFTQFFAIHILPYVPILVHLPQYLQELEHFCNTDP